MIKYFCDRCGKEMENTEDDYVKDFYLQGIGRKYQVCTECYEHLCSVEQDCNKELLQTCIELCRKCIMNRYLEIDMAVAEDLAKGEPVKVSDDRIRRFLIQLASD